MPDMTDQLMILAEAGGSGGVPAPLVGIGFFIALMAMLGITLLASGGEQGRRGTRKHDDH